jgi:hypothetical protein
MRIHPILLPGSDFTRQGTLRGAVSLSLRSTGLRFSLSGLDVAQVNLWEGAVAPCMAAMQGHGTAKGGT